MSEDETARPVSPRPSLEARITQRITSDGSVIVSPKLARWLEQQADMTADRRMRLRVTDPDAYVELAALHLAALNSVCGTNAAAAQTVSADLTMWISTNEAAKALHVTDRCVRNWCRTKRIRAVRSGGRWLVDRTTLNLRNIA